EEDRREHEHGREPARELLALLGGVHAPLGRVRRRARLHALLRGLALAPAALPQLLDLRPAGRLALLSLDLGFPVQLGLGPPELPVHGARITGAPLRPVRPLPGAGPAPSGGAPRTPAPPSAREAVITSPALMTDALLAAVAAAYST